MAMQLRFGAVLLVTGFFLCSGCDGASIFLSTSGDDANAGTSADKPLATPEAARSRAIQLNINDISVAPGTYSLTETLTFDARSSNQHWHAAGSQPTSFTGGAKLGPWEVVKRSAADVLTLVQAHLPVTVKQDRHLFINDARAQRTRLSGDAFSQLFGPTPPSDAARIDDNGFALSSKAMLPRWQRDGLGAEFVFPQSTSPWTEPRCAVQSAKPGRLNMMQPCWHNLRHKACGQIARGTPGYVENVGPAYIANPGEWAINHTSQVVVYALREGETAESIQGVMPALDVLVNVTGAHDIRFSGMRFEHATWTRPGEADGYVEQQTGCCAVGTNPLNGDCNSDRYWSVKSPGNVAVVDSSNISFVGVEFTRLGGVALDFTRTKGCQVQGCYVHDVSGSGIQIGSFAPNDEDYADGSLDVDNTVRDTIVTQAAVEYSGAAGINVGYTRGTLLEHNDVSNLTYVGITAGWGWSRHECWNCTNAGWTTIRGNNVHDYKKALNDGGGIYMLGPQNGSVIHHNWVHNQGTASSGALYPDEGSAYSTWFSNVVTQIGKSEWLHLWTQSIHNVTVRDNFADTNVFLNHGTDCPMINNTIFQPGQTPAAAKAIMDQAGVRKGANRWRY